MCSRIIFHYADEPRGKLKREQGECKSLASITTHYAFFIFPVCPDDWRRPFSLYNWMSAVDTNPNVKAHSIHGQSGSARLGANWESPTTRLIWYPMGVAMMHDSASLRLNNFFFFFFPLYIVPLIGRVISKRQNPRRKRREDGAREVGGGEGGGLH